LKTNLLVFPGGTDSRYIRGIILSLLRFVKILRLICDHFYFRGVGIPAIGFSPMNNTPVLLHDNDEFLKADIYLRGIEIYKKIIDKIANLED
jgi:aminoacylase